MSCREGCPTQDHDSYAQCCRDSGLRVAYANSTNGWDFTRQKRWEGELADYRKLRAEGSQPRGTDRAHLEATKRVSDKTGQPFKG